MNNVQTLTYVEDFFIDLSQADAFMCDGVKVDNNVLRGFNDYEQVDSKTDYMGLIGASSKYLFAYSNKTFRRYDGEAVKNLLIKSSNPSPYSEDACHEVYREKAYLAFDNDGIMLFEDIRPAAIKCAALDDARDIAVVNERLTMLMRDGLTLHFPESGAILISDGQRPDYVVPSITLPSAVQALCRFDNNTLYALGSTIYKLSFSADEQDIKVVSVADGLGEVVMHTVVKLGNRIVFATRNGLYALHNNTVKPIFTELNKAVVSYDKARATAWRGKYTLTVPSLKGRCGYVLDIDNNKCDAILVNNVVDVYSFQDADVIVTASGTLERSVADRYRAGAFVRSNIDFGSSRVKHLRRLVIATKYDVQVDITDGDGVRRIYNVKGSNKPQRLRIYGKGRAFGLAVRSLGQMEVTQLSLTAQTYKEDYYVI